MKNRDFGILEMTDVDMGDKFNAGLIEAKIIVFTGTKKVEEFKALSRQRFITIYQKFKDPVEIPNCDKKWVIGQFI